MDSGVILRITPDGKRGFICQRCLYNGQDLCDVLIADLTLEKPRITQVVKQVGDGLESFAFHPNGKVVGHLHGDFLEMSTEDFAAFVAEQEPSDIEYEILSTVVEGTTAAVKVRDKYLGITFLDTLSLIKIDDEWSIYNKLFNVEE